MFLILEIPTAVNDGRSGWFSSRAMRWLESENTLTVSQVCGTAASAGMKPAAK